MNKISVPVFIGSKSRLLFPMAKLYYPIHLFIEPQEKEDYTALYSHWHKIIVMPKNDCGFPYLLNQMLKHAAENRIEYFMFSDDDIRGIVDRRNQPTDLDKVFREMINIMQAKKYSQFMLSFIGHNWFTKEDIKEKIGAWGIMINRTADLVAVGGYDDKIKIFNDYDMSAKLIRDGYKTACYYKYMFKHKMKGMDGGAAGIYKQPEIMTNAIAYLKNKYGSDCVREVEKHGQKEIRFNWGKL